jgi:hypothetical protein
MNLQINTRGVAPGFSLVATCSRPFLESPIPEYLWARHAPHNIERGHLLQRVLPTVAVYEQDDSLSNRSAVG